MSDPTPNATPGPDARPAPEDDAGPPASDPPSRTPPPEVEHAEGASSVEAREGATTPAAPLTTPPDAATQAQVEADDDRSALVRLAARVRRDLDDRGIGPMGLCLIATGVAALAALCFALDHPGLGAVLGGIAVLVGDVASTPDTPDGDPTAQLAAGWNGLVDLVLLAGLVTATRAGELGGLALLLSLAALVLTAWLPHLQAVAAAARGRPTEGLWRRAERLGVLLVGALLGRLVAAFCLVLVVGALDAWLRLARLEKPDDVRAGPAFLVPVLTPAGGLVTWVRTGSLLLALLLMLVLPQAAGWRF